MLCQIVNRTREWDKGKYFYNSFLGKKGFPVKNNFIYFSGDIMELYVATEYLGYFGINKMRKNRGKNEKSSKEFILDVHMATKLRNFLPFLYLCKNIKRFSVSTKPDEMQIKMSSYLHKRESIFLLC